MKNRFSYIHSLKWMSHFFLWILLIFLTPLHVQAESQTDPTQILFIGNSKTLYYNIPEKFENLAISGKKNIAITTTATNSKTLKELAALHKKKWTASQYDYAVIQPSTPDLKSYQKLSSGISTITQILRETNPNIKIFIRETWLTTDASKTRTMLSQKYVEKAAKKNNAEIIFDGTAFDFCKKLNPAIRLFRDSLHQSETGAYLAACCIYKSIFDESPIGLTYKAGLSKATLLQHIASYSKKNFLIKNNRVILNLNQSLNLRTLIPQATSGKTLFYSKNSNILKVSSKNKLYAYRTGTTELYGIHNGIGYRFTIRIF